MAESMVPEQLSGWLTGRLMLGLRWGLAGGCLLMVAAAGARAQEGAGEVVNLPSSKQLLLPVPGDPQRLNSLPMSLAASPDGRWVVTLNAGYGTYESGYAESLAVMDTRSG